MLCLFCADGWPYQQPMYGGQENKAVDTDGLESEEDDSDESEGSEDGSSTPRALSDDYSDDPAHEGTYESEKYGGTRDKEPGEA